MATVTFPIELGGSGLVVSDDTDPTTGLRNGGYLTRFVPALQQTVAVAGFVVGQVSNAAASASAAAGSASAASSSASSAASSAASAATLYDQFDDRYLGPKASNPTVDNDGNALLVGAMYFNTSALETRVWNGTTWQTASVNGGTVNSLIVTGALQYQGTLTGGTGVIDIGGGQIFKDALGNVGFGTASPGSKLEVASNAADQFRLTRAGVRSYLHSVDDSGNLSISDGGSFSLNFTPAGNIGLGVTPNAWGSQKAIEFQYGALSAGNALGTELVGNAFYNGTNWIYRETGTAFRYNQSSAGHSWFTAPSGTAGNPITFTQAMTLTQGGNLLVGTTTDFAKLAVNGGIYAAASNDIQVGNANNTNSASINSDSADTSAALVFKTAAAGIARAEAARITSAGYFKASNTGVYANPSGSFHEIVGDDNSETLLVDNRRNNSNAIIVHTRAIVGAFAGFHFLSENQGGQTVYQVLANGNVQNTNNSYGAISDPKLKDIIGPKSSTWEKTKQYNWIEYYLKSDTEHTFKMLGLNAEEAAAISPGVVDESPDLVEVTKVRQVPVQIVRLDENENPTVDEESGEVIYDEVMVDEEYTEWEPNGEFTKSVKYSVVSMQYHRTTQECQQRIESLEAAKVQADDLIQQIMARVAALESASA